MSTTHANDAARRRQRKADHLEWAVRLHVDRPSVFADVHVVHASLADFDVDTLDPRTSVAGLGWEWPLMIGAATGGCEAGKRVNAALARTAARHQIPIAVGSQCAALADGADRDSYTVVRRYCPDGIVFANMPARCTPAQARDAIEMLGANGLQLHLNGLQELLMPEGDRRAGELVGSVQAVAEAVSVPVIVKEVGFGMSRRTAAALHEAGAAAIDIGGRGGTSFASIESHRASPQLPRDAYRDWGLPTAASLAEVSCIAPDLDIIAGGGIKDGHEILKSLVMGARGVSICGEFLAVLARDGEGALDTLVQTIKRELLVGMAALGARTVEALTEVEYVVTGETASWLMQRDVPLGRNSGASAS